MTVTDVHKDFDSLSLTLTADFHAPIERVWQLWADPRQLERWWGPPTWPATVVEHDLTPGGDVSYYMTGPEGEKAHGWWRISSINPPGSLAFTDGFADADGKPLTDSPVSTVTMRLTEQAGGTHMELRSVFDSREQMEEMVRMGMVEGLTESVGQMDALLAG